MLDSIDYGEISEKRKQEARGRADRRGFVFLGFVKRLVDGDYFAYLSQNEDVVCRLEDNEIRFYSIPNGPDSLAGAAALVPLAYTIDLTNITSVTAHYQPTKNYGEIQINLAQLPGFGLEYVHASVLCTTEEAITDAFILIQDFILSDKHPL